MITGAIKNKFDKIWTDIWAGGITNPLTVIEQLTYLMFIRSLDEKELETEELENSVVTGLPKIFPASAAGQSMRWSKFKNRDPREIYDVIGQKVFPAIKNMKYGCLPDFDEHGELVEIPDDAGKPDERNTAGQNGQFRTPKHIREMMVELVTPMPDDMICENCTTSLIRVAAA